MHARRTGLVAGGGRVRHFMAGHGQGRLVIFGRVQVPQRQEVRVLASELVDYNDPRTQDINQERGAEAAAPQQRVARRQNRGPAVKCGERVEKSVTAGDGQIVIPDQRDKPVDPGRLEEGHVGGRRIGQLDFVGQSGEPGGQPLQRPAAAKGITGNHHRRGQSWKFLARRRHDHDRSGHGRHQPHHALEHPLRTEGEPGLGLTHPPALTAAQNHRSHDQGRSSSPSVNKPIWASLHRVSASSQSPRKAATAGRSQRSAGTGEIIPLGTQRQERQPVGTGDWLDGHTPVGAALADRRGHGVVRSNLDRESRRPAAGEQSIKQAPRSASPIAVDHQARGSLHGAVDRLGRRAAGEQRIVGAVHQTLHPAVTGKKTNARGKKRRVVRVALRIQQVYPGEIALAPGRRVQPSLRSDPERPGANPPLGHETQQQIEPDGVRASISPWVSGPRPAIWKRTGATNSWKVKIAEVGNPGRMATGVDPAAPRQIGLPGLSATPCTTMPGDRWARTRYDRSPPPLLVPPLSNTTSAVARPLSSASSRADWSSPTIPSGTGWQPSSRTASASNVALASYTAAGRGGAPGAINSAPVATMATRGRRSTGTSARPMAASSPVSRAESSVPRRSTSSPLATSVPAKLRLAPGATA